MKLSNNHWKATCIMCAVFFTGHSQICGAQPKLSPASDSKPQQSAKQTYLYCSNLADSSVSEYLIEEDGSLTPLEAKPVYFGGASYPVLVFAPSGRFAYIASDVSNIISQFALGTDGALSPLNPPTVDTGKEPQTPTIDPTGHFAYVANMEDNTVSEFRISGDGKLVPVLQRAFQHGRRPSSIQFSPDGRAVYMLNTAGTLTKQNVARPDTSGMDGTNTQSNAVLPGNEEIVDNMGDNPALGAGPRTLTFGVGGKTAYLLVVGTGESQNNLYQYHLARDGSLQPLAQPRVPVGIAPGIPTLDPLGRYLYVCCPSEIYEFGISATGGLKPLPVPFQRTLNSSGGLVIDPTGRFAYQNNYADSCVSQYRIGAGGVLMPMTPAYLPTGASPQVPLVDPSGRFLYVPNSGSDDISQFRIGSDGKLSPLSPRTIPAGKGPIVLSVRQQ